MKRKTEYVFGWVECLIQYKQGETDCDIDGMANKRQADKYINEEMAGENNDADSHKLAWVRKYIWYDGDLMSDDDYWINPAIVDEGEGDGYQ